MGHYSSQRAPGTFIADLIRDPEGPIARLLGSAQLHARNTKVRGAPRALGAGHAHGQGAARQPAMIERMRSPASAIRGTGSAPVCSALCGPRPFWRHACRCGDVLLLLLLHAAAAPQVACFLYFLGLSPEGVHWPSPAWHFFLHTLHCMRILTGGTWRVLAKRWGSPEGVQVGATSQVGLGCRA